ncbi:MerR family transcriptional regulator [Sphingomonas profundi]|uniref:MerR family transcriptional regulator n=1 Tax=Alterirhizorhabdus profundi TaxID=2681549 RepID=UPI0012E77730|nr:MerR family DNA-binding protein [Sphingomonas profundi]
MASLTISALARAGGVGVETVRYYQRRGLLDQPERPFGPGSGGGVRRYGEAETQRLKFIRAAQRAGFSLEEIRELVALDRDTDRVRIRTLARQRLGALDRRIDELQAARAWLGELEGQCASGEEGPCPIIEAFVGPAVD